MGVEVHSNPSLRIAKRKLNARTPEHTPIAGQSSSFAATPRANASRPPNVTAIAAATTRKQSLFERIFIGRSRPNSWFEVICNGPLAVLNSMDTRAREASPGPSRPGDTVVICVASLRASAAPMARIGSPAPSRPCAIAPGRPGEEVRQHLPSFRLSGRKAHAVLQSTQDSGRRTCYGFSERCPRATSVEDSAQ